MRAALLVLAVLVAGALAQLLWAADHLPERVATHFNTRGQADGWMSRNAALWFQGLIVLGLPGFLLALAAVLPRLPLALVNIPHKEYWFAPERRAASWRYLRTWMVWMVDLSLLFVALLFQAMYQANAQGPEPRLGGFFWFTMGLFLAGTLFLVVLLYRHFRLPSAGEGETSAP